MAWFLGIFFSIIIILFLIGGYLQKLTEREKVDPEFKKNMDKKRVWWDPKITFIENLFMWGFVLIVIYFIYLGGVQ